MRLLLQAILGELLKRHRGTGRVDFNDIVEVIQGRGVSYEEIELLIEKLEAAGLRVAEPLSGQDVVLMRSVLVSAHRLRARLSRRPTVDEIASECGHPPHAVRRALEHGRRAARLR